MILLDILSWKTCMTVFVTFLVTTLVEWGMWQTSCQEGNVYGIEKVHVEGEDISQAETLDNSQYQVPNIVHYNWYASEHTAFKFKHWISVLSAFKILKPDNIFIHFNLEPTGEYWENIKKIPSVKLLEEGIPDSLFGEEIPESDFITAPSNIGRIQALLETGGIYLDFDVLVIQSFDELRKYPCTLGYETPSLPCGGIIICSKDSPFLYIWANAYLDDYRPNSWAYNTGWKPGQLAKRFPMLVHREMVRLHRPNYNLEEIGKIWGNETWEWKTNYAVHTWYRRGQKYRSEVLHQTVEPDKNNIWSMNNTYGEICRYILELPS